MEHNHEHMDHMGHMDHSAHDSHAAHGHGKLLPILCHQSLRIVHLFPTIHFKLK